MTTWQTECHYTGTKWANCTEMLKVDKNQRLQSPDMIDDDEEQIDFNMAYSPNTAKTGKCSGQQAAFMFINDWMCQLFRT